jgi:cytochrome P450
LASLRYVIGPPGIKSENARPNAWIYVDIRNIDIGTYVESAKRAVAENIELPPGYTINWSGQYEYMQRAEQRLMVVVPLTVLIIFVIIYLNTQSLIKTAIVFLAVPFSLVGAIWLIYLLGYNMSIAVWVGIIALAEMLETWRLGETRDINLEMTQFMRRVTSSLLFGVEQTEVAYAIGEMIDDWVRLNHETGMGALISDPSFTEGYDQLLHMAEQLERALQKMIEPKRGQGGLGHDVLSLLLGAHDEGSKLTDAELVGHAALLFGAAHLTTANTLSWTLFLLAEHPLIMQEVGREIRTKVSGESPALEEIPQLKVLDRVIKESMRILPASAYLQRMCAEEVQLGPISLPRGTMVVFSQFMTHRIPELYPEPDLFQPDRWLDLSPSPFAYFPFGAGARMCLGASLAMMTLKTTLPTILKRYRLMMSPNCEVNGSVISTMLSPTGPLQMEIHPVDCQFEARPVTGNIHDLVRLSGVSDSAGKSSRIAA